MLAIDKEKAGIVAPILYQAFLSEGIHGRRDMPEDRPPAGVKTGSLTHLLFLTLTVSIDYQRNADALWESARRTYEDPDTRYLFDPSLIRHVSFGKMIDDMQRYGLSKKIRNDAFIWRTVALSFLKKWDGDPRNFLASCNWDAPTILRRLREDQHFDGRRITWDFPFLRGPKIGPLWVRMLRDNGKVGDIKNLEEVPIPVDVHVARATLALGIVKGSYQGSPEGAYAIIREAWKQGVRGIQTGERPMIALDVDESLWHLSKYGCAKRDDITGECPVREECVMKEYCIPGKICFERDGLIIESGDPAKTKTGNVHMASSSKNGKKWIATVTLESSTYKYPDNNPEKNARKNEDRMAALFQITRKLASTYSGQGIILFPGGYFHSGITETATYIPQITDTIRPLLQEIYKDTSASIIICLGIDGKVLLEDGPLNRYDANQVAIVISKDGLIAYAKKFHPTDESEAQVLDLARDYLSPEQLGNASYTRFFTHAGRCFYIAVCNDIKGLKGLQRPSFVDGILNCVHGCYNRGDGPTCSYFVRLNFAGTSQDWNCPVFGAVVFFKRVIAEKWRTGIFYRMWDKAPIQCDTDENALAPVQTDSSVSLEEGLAQVDVYDLDTVCSKNPQYRIKTDYIQKSTRDTTVRKKERLTAPSPESGIYEQIRTTLDQSFSCPVIEQKTKVTYRGRNTIGYPNKTELDMISLFRPSATNPSSIKFRIYPYVLAAHLGIKNPEEIIRYLPSDSVIRQERENPHPAEVFIAGRFSNENEIERFLTLVKIGKD